MNRAPFWRLGVSVLMLALVMWQVAPQDLWQSLRGVAPGWLALAALALALQILLSALRWQVTARALGMDLPRRRALGEYGLAVFSNTFLPGGVLGDVTRALRARHLQGWRRAAASVVIERLAGQVALGLWALGAVVVWLGPEPGGLLLAGAGLIGLMGLLALRRFAPEAGPALRRSWTGAAVWPAQLGLTLAILALNIFGFWAAARAVGVDLPAFAAAFLIPLTLLVMVVPVTVNGWGLREGAAAALWPLMGVGATSAVAASIAFGIACALAAIAGAMVWLLQPDDAPRPRSEG
ncbi:MAG: lysylphosphatidylglycerol synthase transmembrane domain-containing protein [Pseudorhodobacter sp.]